MGAGPSRAHSQPQHGAGPPEPPYSGATATVIAIPPHLLASHTQNGAMEGASDADASSDAGASSSGGATVLISQRRSLTPLKRVESRVPVKDVQDQPLLSQARKILEDQRSK